MRKETSIKKTARKYFGTDDAIGKVLVADGKENFTVSGVINDFPLNSSINFDMIMPMSYHVKSMLVNSELLLMLIVRWLQLEKFELILIWSVSVHQSDDCLCQECILFL